MLGCTLFCVSQFCICLGYICFESYNVGSPLVEQLGYYN